MKALVFLSLSLFIPSAFAGLSLSTPVKPLDGLSTEASSAHCAIYAPQLPVDKRFVAAPGSGISENDFRSIDSDLFYVTSMYLDPRCESGKCLSVWDSTYLNYNIGVGRMENADTHTLHFFIQIVKNGKMQQNTGTRVWGSEDNPYVIPQFNLDLQLDNGETVTLWCGDKMPDEPK